MSNTSKVTPIASGTSAAAEAAGAALAAAMAGVAVGTALAAAAVCRFLNEESEAEAQAVTARRVERDLSSWRARDPATRSIGAYASLPLTVRDSIAIRGAAERLGFRPVAAPMVTTGDVNYTLLQCGKERLAIAETRDGVVLQTNHARLDTARAVVRQHSIDRVGDYLARRKMTASVVRLANGEVEIRAQEPGAGDGEPDRAVVTARVRSDGAVDVDVDRCVGRRCEEFVGGIATAIDGKVQEVKHKDAWYAEASSDSRTRQRSGY